MNLRNLMVFTGTTIAVLLNGCGIVKSGISQDCDQLAAKLLSSSYKYAIDHNEQYIRQVYGGMNSYTINSSGEITSQRAGNQTVIEPRIKNGEAISCSLLTDRGYYRVTETKDNITWESGF